MQHGIRPQGSGNRGDPMIPNPHSVQEPSPCWVLHEEGLALDKDCSDQFLDGKTCQKGLAGPIYKYRVPLSPRGTSTTTSQRRVVSCCVGK